MLNAIAALVSSADTCWKFEKHSHTGLLRLAKLYRRWINWDAPWEDPRPYNIPGTRLCRLSFRKLFGLFIITIARMVSTIYLLFNSHLQMSNETMLVVNQIVDSIRGDTIISSFAKTFKLINNRPVIVFFPHLSSFWINNHTTLANKCEWVWNGWKIIVKKMFEMNTNQQGIKRFCLNK